MSGALPPTADREVVTYGARRSSSPQNLSYIF